MIIDWLLIEVVALNLFFSTFCDMCAKYWGITNNQNWLYAGLAINMITIFLYMYAVKLGGLAITTSVILLITMAISVSLGFFFFHEQIHLSQWMGIGVGFLAVILISGILIPAR
jgi:drug/metabolite transporter (DMT)-like permease